MPKLLPLPMMLAQRPVIEASSSRFNIAGMKAVSVVANPATAPACRVAPQASIPLAIGKGAAPPGTEANAALLVQEVAPPPATATLASVLSSLITTELGRMPVKVLLTRSPFTDKDTKPLGVIRQEQQEINCSSGENA